MLYCSIYNKLIYLYTIIGKLHRNAKGVILKSAAADRAEGKMNEKLFRKKSLERVSSPEQLNDYIKVSNPGIWLSLAAIVVLLVGVCVWAVFGRLESTLQVAAVKSDGRIVCFVKEDDIDKVNNGMTVRIGDDTCKIVGIEREPVPVDESFKEYGKHVGGLTDGEWVYVVYTDWDGGDEGDVFSADIIIKSVKPASFVFN